MARYRRSLPALAQSVLCIWVISTSAYATSFTTLHNIRSASDGAPTPGGAWTGQVIYNFNGGIGYSPRAGLLLGAADILFSGGTRGLDTVYSPAPPAAPGASPGGVLYGTAAGGGQINGGAVFLLAPPSLAGSWTESLLYLFDPTEGHSAGIAPLTKVVIDAAVLYGTAVACTSQGNGFTSPTCESSACGAVWGGAHAQCPTAGVSENQGVLYGATSAGGAYRSGTVFSLAP